MSIFGLLKAIGGGAGVGNALMQNLNPQQSGNQGLGAFGDMPGVSPVQEGGQGILGGIGQQSDRDMSAIEGAGATREQEGMARQRGFKSYAEMLAWAQARNRQTGGTIGRGEQTAGDARTMQGVAGNAMQAHPKSVFEYISGILKGANGQ